MTRMPRRPVFIPCVLDDPSTIDALIDRHAPYWPVQRYFANDAEYAALSGNERGAMPVGPVFRGNWATEGKPEEGVAELLHLPRFIDAARELFDAEIVRPHNVYVNLTWQLPFPQGRGHTDVPAFRGFDRTQHPITLLTIMGMSGLFEDVRTRIATAVAWFYEGSDGGFEYWPNGPDAPSVVHEGAITNTAIVGDNDFMWHRVRPVGRIEDGMPSLTFDSELVRLDADTWAIRDGEREIARFPRRQIRVSVSWKAVVFASEEERRLHDEHVDDLTLDEVLRRFSEDLRRRGTRLEIPSDPERDPGFIATLHDAYIRYPAAYAA
ncbi:MAG TPA: hypothetical protein VIS07_23035 [Candidatus Binatia bacterium]